ncbi:hypothetical protein IC617_10920 [Neiella sp. HB171785]|uniref:Uncharacterized protein n=1 Tax=Neiella litorisoli TaxID=2771431 RepID=A0A8J6UM51_9GAMM|nr:hypothetical protein [Neiella litorisoli]MBD1389940.1 hypothetical protein [Neiella litorisoli]
MASASLWVLNGGEVDVMSLNFAAIQLLADLDEAGSIDELAANRGISRTAAFAELKELDLTAPAVWLRVDSPVQHVELTAMARRYLAQLQQPLVNAQQMNLSKLIG